MKKQRNLLHISLFFTLSFAMVSFVGGNKQSSIPTFADGGQSYHYGYHYARNENTLIKNGNKEFWYCTLCDQIFFSQPAIGDWIYKETCDFANLENTDAFIPSTATDIGNLANTTTVAGHLDGYAFSDYCYISGYAQQFLLDDIDISRYQKVTFAIKSESLWFIVQDPDWEKPLENGYWYQVILEQFSPGVWDVYVGELGTEPKPHANGIHSSNLKAVAGLGSSYGTFYITNFMAYYTKADPKGVKVDECLFTANGIQTFDTNEPVPTGFEQVRSTITKTNDGSFFTGEYYSAFDLSNYTKVTFAIKTVGYFLCNHLWNNYVCGTRDWLIFNLTKTNTYTWDLVITDYNGQTYYQETGLSGHMEPNPGVYTTNSLNAILYGTSVTGGFYAAKRNGYDLVVYTTEIRASNPITIGNGYKIIYQGGDKNYKKAADDLQYRIGKASMVDPEQTNWSIYIPVQQAGSETYSSESKIISIGNTSFATSAGVSADSSMGLGGYAVVTKGKSIIITANSSRGIAPALELFLEKILDYDCFAYPFVDQNDPNPYVHAINTYKKTTSIVVESMEIYSKSSIGLRQITTNTHSLPGGNKTYLGYSYDNNGSGHLTADVHTLGNEFLSYDDYHNSYPEWYEVGNDGIQLCFCKHNHENKYNVMLNNLFIEIRNKLIDYMNSPETCDIDTIYVDLSMRDNWQEPTCNDCLYEIQNVYGTYAGQILHFVSDVADMVDAWVNNNASNKTIRYLTLAYQQAQEPPASLNYTLNQHVITYFASPKADFSKPYNSSVPNSDDNGDTNKNYYDQLVKWSKLYKSIGYNDNLWFWAYGNQTQCHMFPYNDFEMTQPLIRTLYDLGVSSVHIETPFNSKTPSFEDLNLYVKGKLLNDCEIDYSATVNKFMTYYYGPAANNMKAYYEQIKSVIKTNVKGTIFGDANNESYWPLEMVQSLLLKHDACLDDIYCSGLSGNEISDYLYRVNRERIMPLFILLEHYMLDDAFSKTQMQNYLNQFKGLLDVEHNYKNYEITMFNHNTSMDTKIDRFDKIMKYYSIYKFFH